MTKTNATQVLLEYPPPPTGAGRAPPLPDHAGSIPGNWFSKERITNNDDFCFKRPNTKLDHFGLIFARI